MLSSKEPVGVADTGDGGVATLDEYEYRIGAVERVPDRARTVTARVADDPR